MKKNRLYYTSISIIIVLITIFNLTPKDKELKGEKLDRKIEFIDSLGLLAILITFIIAAFAFYYKNKQNEELKAQRQQDQIKIANSNENAESAKRDAAIANEKAALSNEKAAKAELKSKELELELMKLRLAVADRFIPEFTKSTLGGKLAGFPNKKIRIVCAISNNAEPMNFSRKLNDFFNSIGWNVSLINQSNLIIPAPTGFKIFVLGKKNKNIADIIFEAFRDINYECEIHQVEEDLNTDLIIQVWGK